MVEGNEGKGEEGTEGERKGGDGGREKKTVDNFVSVSCLIIAFCYFTYLLFFLPGSKFSSCRI